MFLRHAVLACLVQSAYGIADKLSEIVPKECDCESVLPRHVDDTSVLQVKINKQEKGVSFDGGKLGTGPGTRIRTLGDTHEIWLPAASPAASLQQRTAQRQQSPTAVRVSNRRDAQAG